MASLLALRNKFLENPYTIKNITQDFQAWRKGRSRYAFWAVDVDFTAVQQQLSFAQQYLEKFLIADYCRQPHITLGISGFLSDQSQGHQASHADDYVASSFEADIAALKRLQIEPFKIEIGALASFSSAPFLHVNDPTNSLHQLHGCLHAVSSDVHFHYVPHVTIGLYSEAWSTCMVSNYLDAFSNNTTISLLVNKISLMSYAAAEIGGKLLKIADYDLAHAGIQWHEQQLFESEHALREQGYLNA